MLVERLKSPGPDTCERANFYEWTKVVMGQSFRTVVRTEFIDTRLKYCRTVQVSQAAMALGAPFYLLAGQQVERPVGLELVSNCADR